MVISNHNSFRVLLDKIASYIFSEKYTGGNYMLALKMTSTVPIVSAHFRSLLVAYVLDNCNSVPVSVSICRKTAIGTQRCCLSTGLQFRTHNATTASHEQI